MTQRLERRGKLCVGEGEVWGRELGRRAMEVIQIGNAYLGGRGILNWIILRKE